MNGLNIGFMKDPIGFIDKQIVNMSAFLGEDFAAIGRNINAINTTKAGLFDFQEWKSNVKIRFLGLASANASPEKDTAVLGYFCPFNGGNDDPPGWVDVPRVLALHRFVFTPTMNGCAFVITDSPTPGCFRVHHHQHPKTPTHDAEKPLVGAANEFDRFSVAEYDLGSTDQRVRDGTFFGTFNFLYLKDDEWWFGSSMSEWSNQHDQSFLAKLFSSGGPGDKAVWKRPENYHSVTRKAAVM
jgi:hypothetical protein